MRTKMVINNVKVVQTKLWCAVVVMAMVMEAAALNGPNVCMVQQKYNITKRVKYRAPMSVRTYEWCFSMPPRCSKWKTEMRELTKLETDERIAEVAVCCPGYKMKDVSCVPICPNGKTGHRCSDDCPPNKWGPNCVNECEPCYSGSCSPITGDCSCQDGWQGESCEIRMRPSTSTTTTAEDLLTIPATKTTTPAIPFTRTLVPTTSTKSIETTLSSRSNLLESNSHPHRLKPSPEVTTVMSYRSATVFTSLPSSTTLPDTSTSTISTTNKPATAETVSSTSSPLIIKTTQSTLTTLSSTPKTVITSEIIPTTMEATTVLDTITVQTITPIPSIETSTTGQVITPPRTTVTALVVSTKAEEKVLDTKKNTFKTTPESEKLTTLKDNVISTSRSDFIEETTSNMTMDSIYNRTEVPVVRKNTNHELQVPVKIRTDTIKVEIQHNTVPQKTTDFNNVSVNHITTTPFFTTTGGPAKIETTKRPPSTIRYFPTTVKFKPKEIWIRPAQKGESFLKIKSEMNQDTHLKIKNDTNVLNTTPKTIMVSIIPTSVSYASFKKIAFTTASLISQKTNLSVVPPNETTRHDVTKPMTMLTSTENPITKNFSVIRDAILINSKSNKTKEWHSFKSYTDRTTTIFPASQNTTTLSKNLTFFTNGTNSMTNMEKDPKSSISITTPSTNAIQTTQLSNITLDQTSKSTVNKSAKPTKQFTKIVTVKPRNVTIITVSGKNKNETIVKITKTIAKDVEKTNATRIKDIISKTNSVTTESPDDEEKFHILTEPEHITAVMEGKGKDRTSVDLVSVISIAGGIMMAVITVAVIIVMVERCKRPRYDDVRKVSDIRMQVMIDNDVPPYVRSIFHTPLPDPPTSEKCHYQPISTLDRNLKQFMRPVVVQSISPIMLENFRGILECHYDHLPRRSHNFDITQRHDSLAPSLDDVDELSHLRPCSTMDSTIDALKCEARLDVIDSTTSEPLYAEIPCWRPPSEHAIEIINLNGEAVTEL